MTVIDLLEEIEDIVETSSKVPMTNKIMVDGNELLEIVREIRTSMPDDVQQAKWINDEKSRILSEAKDEYEKIIVEAKKQADYLVDENDITKRARKRSEEIKREAVEYAKVVKMRTYDYLDKALYDMQAKFDALNDKYLSNMFEYMSSSFKNMGEELQKNREELKDMAERTKNE